MFQGQIDPDSAAPVEASAIPDVLFERGLYWASGRSGVVNLVAAHKWFNLAALKGRADAILPGFLSLSHESLTLNSASPSPETIQRSHSPLRDAPNSISTLSGRCTMLPTDCSRTATSSASEPRAALNLSPVAFAISSPIPTSDSPLAVPRPPKSTLLPP